MNSNIFCLAIVKLTVQQNTVWIHGRITAKNIVYKPDWEIILSSHHNRLIAAIFSFCIQNKEESTISCWTIVDELNFHVNHIKVVSLLKWKQKKRLFVVITRNRSNPVLQFLFALPMKSVQVFAIFAAF